MRLAAYVCYLEHSYDVEPRTTKPQWHNTISIYFGLEVYRLAVQF